MFLCFFPSSLKIDKFDNTKIRSLSTLSIRKESHTEQGARVFHL